MSWASGPRNRRKKSPRHAMRSRAGCMSRALALESRKVHTLRNEILDPVGVPPFFRINLYAIELHGEVNVVASGHPCLTAGSHRLTAFHQVAFLHIDLAQMAVDGLQPIAMINHDTVSVNAQRSRINHLAIVRGLYANMLRNRKIVSK